MSRDGRLALGAGAGLATLVMSAFLIEGGETVTPRGPEFVQLPKKTFLKNEAPVAITPIPTPLESPPAAATPPDLGIWSTPAQFAPPE